MESIHAGIRTSKTVNGVMYNYYYVGSQLARMTYGDNVLDFFYDINGVPIAMRHGYASHNNYVVYYYITNLQGDVIRLVDYLGNTAAYYEYDPYGNAIQAAGSHANVNPLRYRGYVYDTDTGLYYLQSRYYDPKVGRFINADVYASTGQGVLGHNMFAYCLNNPVNHIDKSGRVADDWAGWIGEQVGEFIYELITGDDHPSHQTRELENQVRLKQLRTMKSILKSNEYEEVKNSNMTKTGLGLWKISSGVNTIKAGLKLVLVPCPTIADDLMGVGLMVFGVVKAAYGLVEVIVGLAGGN